jgi:hypothetical protein
MSGNNPTNPPEVQPTAATNNPTHPNNGLGPVKLVRANRQPGSRHPFNPTSTQNGKGRRTRRKHQKSRKTHKRRR